MGEGRCKVIRVRICATSLTWRQRPIVCRRMFNFPPSDGSIVDIDACTLAESSVPDAGSKKVLRLGTAEIACVRCIATAGQRSGAAKRLPMSTRLVELPKDWCLSEEEQEKAGYNFQPLQEDQFPRMFPLSTYSKSAKIRIPFAILRKSSFFSERLDNVWQGKTVIDIVFPTQRLLEAFLVAAQILAAEDPQNIVRCPDDVEAHNQFEMFAVASVLQLPGLREQAAEYIKSHMDSNNFMVAVQLAQSYRSTKLLRTCFFWMKGQGIVPLDPAFDGAWWERLMHDGLKSELAVGQYRCATSVFDEIIAADYAAKEHYFNGSHKDALLPTPQDVKSAGTKTGSGFPDMTRCYVERRRGMGEDGNMTHFLVFSEDKNELLIAAASNMETGTFLISKTEDFSVHGNDYLAFVSSSFLGTHFTLYDHGLSEEEAPAGAFPNMMRREHCLVVYESNILGRVPNSMRVALGGAEGNEAVQAGELENRLNLDTQALSILETKKPRWNAELDAWTMDFKGRVKLASKKNFQLIRESEPDKILMLFGKVTKNRFTLDFRAPMTVCKSLAVALSTFADKLAVT